MRYISISVANILAVLSLSTYLIDGNVDISLGLCEQFALFSAAGISFDGAMTTVHTGNIGVSPGTAITGLRQLDAGSEEINTPLANGCRADMTTAYITVDAAACPISNTIADLAGKTLLPGVYCSASSISLSSSSATLDGNQDPNAQWIFQAGTSFISAAATSFTLINGAKVANIYWIVGSATTIGSSSSMVGNIFAQTAITFNSGSTIIGRAFAMTAVTFEGGSLVTLPASVTLSPTAGPILDSTSSQPIICAHQLSLQPVN